jgi:phosphatidate cytidylyltransferase
VIQSSIVKRLLVALWGIPLLLWATYRGGLAFELLIGGISLLGLAEYYKLQEGLGLKPLKYTGFGSGLAVIIAWAMGGGGVVWVMAGAFLFASIITTLQVRSHKDIVATFAGIAYIPFLVGTFLFIRLGHFAGSEYLVDGKWVALCIWGAIWMTDSAAYGGGKAFGKHRIAPDISPKKTLEGFIFGFLGAMLFVVVLYYLGKISLDVALAVGIGAGVFGQIGDLIESKLKRDANVKDAGEKLPGHGGILDRFDSLLVTAPAVALYLVVKYNFLNGSGH